MKPFDLLRTPKIIFGSGSIEKLGSVTSQFGNRALIVRGKRSFATSIYRDTIYASLHDKGITLFEFEIPGEPSPALIDKAVTSFGENIVNCVIAIGGGSVLDSGKAIAAMLPKRQTIMQYLEVVGSSKPDGIKLPFIAVPTTAGTGSEATSNAVISRIGINGFKCSLRHDNYVPDVAIVDPQLALSCPPDITAACGMDTLTQLIEAYVSPKASIVTDSLIEKVLPLVKNSLINAVKNGDKDIESRSEMAYASLVSGIVLSNAGLGVVHGISSVLGAAYPIPHGVACGTLLAPAIRLTVNKIIKESPQSVKLTKYAAIAKLLTNTSTDINTDACKLLVDQLESLTDTIGIKTLSDYGVKKDHFDFLLNNQNCNKNNPVHLSTEEIAGIMACRTN